MAKLIKYLNDIYDKLFHGYIPAWSLNEPLSNDLLQVGLLLQVKQRL